DEQKSSLDSMTSTNNHIQLLQNKDQLTTNFDNISQQLDELKLPNRTECRIEGLDQLLTHVHTMTQQIGRIIQISESKQPNNASAPTPYKLRCFDHSDMNRFLWSDSERSYTIE
ncbi:unnamed protein product, partial [Adineta steineri]